MRPRESRFSPALVISVVALFVALGGGAYAALGPNSIGSKELRTGAVNTKNLRNNSVTKAKIRPGAVGPRQLRDHSVGARKIAGALPGTLVAYALVTPGGVVEAKSRGIDDSNVAQLPLSQYCLSDLPEYQVASVTPASNGHSAVVANIELPPGENNSCDLLDSSKEFIAVTTMTGMNSFITWSHEPFYIFLYR